MAAESPQLVPYPIIIMRDLGNGTEAGITMQFSDTKHHLALRIGKFVRDV